MEKYKGISREKILEIKEDNKPFLYHYSTSKEEIDNVFAENGDSFKTAVNLIVEREARNADICVVCEMALLYLESLEKK